jgi:hypothetical protein
MRSASMCKTDVQNAIPSNNASSYILHRSRRRVRLWSILHISVERIALIAALCLPPLSLLSPEIVIVAALALRGKASQ